MRQALLLSLAGAIAMAACGGTGTTGGADRAPADRQAVPKAASPAATVETRWLRGLWASDIRKALPEQNVRCEGPRQEGKTMAWACEWGTPLVSYKVRFYGSAPGKIEYINATVAQSNQPKDRLTLPLFTTVAGLRFDGGDPQAAKEWVKTTLASGGQTVYGPAKFKLSGDVTRRMLEIKASGSEW